MLSLFRHCSVFHNQVSLQSHFTKVTNYVLTVVVAVARSTFPIFQQLLFVRVSPWPSIDLSARLHHRTTPPT